MAADLHRPPSAVRLLALATPDPRWGAGPRTITAYTNRTTPQTLAGHEVVRRRVRDQDPGADGTGAVVVLSLDSALSLMSSGGEGGLRVRGGRGAVGSAAAVTTVFTTRCRATTMPAPTRSDHGGLSHCAAAAAPRPPRPGSAVCSRARICDGGSTAAGHIGPGPTANMPPAGRPLFPLASLRAQQGWPQSADGWPCKPLSVAAPRRLAVRPRGPGRAAASECPLRSAGAPRGQLFQVVTVSGGSLMWGGALSGPGAPLSGAETGAGGGHGPPARAVRASGPP